jgi:hypothetical protein
VFAISEIYFKLTLRFLINGYYVLLDFFHLALDFYVIN